MITDVRKRNGKKELQKSFRNKQIKKKILTNSRNEALTNPGCMQKEGGGVCTTLYIIDLFL